MERLHMVSRETLLQTAGVAARVAEEALHVRAERARRAAATDRQAQEAEREHTRGYRDTLAAVWETRLRDPRWFADAPIQELMDTWATAEAWAQAGDSRAIATRERLRLQVRSIGLDPDLAQIAIDARDVQALTDLLETPTGPPLDSTTTADLARDTDRDLGGRRVQEDDRQTARAGAAGSGGRSGGTRRSAATALGRDGTSPDDVQEMAELVRGTLHPDVAEMVLADTRWPRVAGQLFRAREKIGQFNQANPQRVVNLRELMLSLQNTHPRGELRSPAGWLIWKLHNATASRGVQLIAQTHARGPAARTGHPAPPRQAPGPAAVNDRPNAQTPNAADFAPDPEPRPRQGSGAGPGACCGGRALVPPPGARRHPPRGPSGGRRRAGAGRVLRRAPFPTVDAPAGNQDPGRGPDATHLAEKHITSWRVLAADYGDDVEVLERDVPMQECIRREAACARAGGRGVAAKVIRRLAAEGRPRWVAGPVSDPAGRSVSALPTPGSRSGPTSPDRPDPTRGRLGQTSQAAKLLIVRARLVTERGDSRGEASAEGTSHAPADTTRGPAPCWAGGQDGSERRSPFTEHEDRPLAD